MHRRSSAVKTVGTLLAVVSLLVLVSIAAIGILSAIGDFPFGIFSDVNNDF